jgi:hypothetical protein
MGINQAPQSTESPETVDELAEFEFTPLAPSEEVDIDEQILIVGYHACR